MVSIEDKPFAFYTRMVVLKPTFKNTNVGWTSRQRCVILFWCHGNLFRENFDVFKQAIARPHSPSPL